MADIPAWNLTEGDVLRDGSTVVAIQRDVSQATVRITATRVLQLRRDTPMTVINRPTDYRNLRAAQKPVRDEPDPRTCRRRRIFGWSGTRWSVQAFARPAGTLGCCPAHADGLA